MLQNKLWKLLLDGIHESFTFFQKIGKCLMLPVSVLPIAGILLGIGSAHFSWLPLPVSNLMAQSGGAIFGSLPLIFAIAVAVGLAGNDGVAALAATVGFVVLLATTGVMAEIFGLVPKEVMGIKSIDTGVFGGIVIGGVAAFLFKRYYRIQLPSYLGFFGGKRFVPIVTALAAIALGVLFSLIWPPIQSGIDTLSHQAAYGNPTIAAALYGVVERILIPFGLHHIWNVPFFFEIGAFTDAAGKVVHGDVSRFFAGDPSAGILGGAYLFKMWGLPAAAIAIWQSAKPEQKSKVGSIMISAALTSFLTGITEPIEFSFLFVAPLLYGAHAILVGLGQVIFGVLGARLGFTFSQGFIDYILYYSLDTKPWLVFVIGPVFALIYYVSFRALIVAFDLKTPGRELNEDNPEAKMFQQANKESLVVGKEKSGGPSPQGQDLAIALVQSFGGRTNIRHLDACITRLRVDVSDMNRVDAERLKSLGARGVLTVGNGIQAIFGPVSENLKSDMESALAQNLPGLDGEDIENRKPGKNGSAGWEPNTPSTRDDRSDGVETIASDPSSRKTNLNQQTTLWIHALGGSPNFLSVDHCASTRLRIVLKDRSQLNQEALRLHGVPAIAQFSSGSREIVHLILGPEAPLYAKEFASVLAT